MPVLVVLVLAAAGATSPVDAEVTATARLADVNGHPITAEDLDRACHDVLFAHPPQATPEDLKRYAAQVVYPMPVDPRCADPAVEGREAASY
jgi:hypothetical protein